MALILSPPGRLINPSTNLIRRGGLGEKLTQHFADSLYRIAGSQQADIDKN